MTVETLTKAPPYTISGIGPYEIPHPYGSGAIHAYVLIDGVPQELSSDLFTVSPESSLIEGDLYLTAAAASDNDGLTLWIERVTPHEQGWAARTGAREAGMENQLDQSTLAAQEDRALLEATLRGRRAMEAFDPKAGHVPVVRADGLGWENGPSVEDILAAQGYVEAANESAVLSEKWAAGTEPGGPGTKSAKEAAQEADASAETAEKWASEDEDVVVSGGKYSAMHYMLKSEATLTQVAAILDTFDDRFLGALSGDPATDNDGDPLVVGATYFNTNTNLMRLYNGSDWQIFGTDVSLALLKANNLSDLPNADAALGNLGLSANAKSLVTAANYAAMRTLLSLKGGALLDVSSDTDLSVDGAKLPTRDAVAGAIGAIPDGLGVSQTWAQYTRVALTVYQNATGRSIAIAGRTGTGSSHMIEVSTDSSTWVTLMDQGSQEAMNGFAIIPPGWYYRARMTNWRELR